MSIAARRSHLGDEYQIRIATYWIIQLLFEDQDLEWVRTDPVIIPSFINQAEFAYIDDIVVRYKDGRTLYIQAKKNQKDWKPWSLSEFADELRKARDQIENDPLGKGLIKFYSRTPFAFRKLVEDSAHYENYAGFQQNASKNLTTSLGELATIIERSLQDTYFFCRKLTFGTHDDYEDWDRNNCRDLERKVPAPQDALEHIESLIRGNQSGLRAIPRQITKDDVVQALKEKGIIVAPYKNEGKIIESFRKASSIGRQKYSRRIAGQKLPRQEVAQILEYLNDGEKNILLIDGPGCGKSWVLIELEEVLQKHEEWGVLFIQGESYCDIESERDFLERSTLPEDVVGLAARLASYRKTVVLLDSLDKIAVSRNQRALSLFLTILDRLATVKGVQVVVACRNFDLSYDPMLRERTWGKTVRLSQIDFASVVSPILKSWGYIPETIPTEQRELLTIPQYLKLFERLVDKEIPLETLTSPYHFSNAFLEEVVVKHREYGDRAIDALQQMACKLVEHRDLNMSKAGFSENEDVCHFLLSNEVLVLNSLGQLAFSHQTLLDTLVTRKALSDKLSLQTFILQYPQLPFIRPLIRTFFFTLRVNHPQRFVSQVRQVFENDAIAYHVKWLIAESLAELRLQEDDLPLFTWLLRNDSSLFLGFLWSLRKAIWFDFLAPNIFQTILKGIEGESIRASLVSKLKEWMNVRPGEVIALWKIALSDNTTVTAQIIFALDTFEQWETPGISNFLEELIVHENDDKFSFLGKAISQYVETTGQDYTLLWKWMTTKIISKQSGHEFKRQLEQGLRCSFHNFHYEEFLKQTLCSSDELLSMCTEHLERWSLQSSLQPEESSCRCIFLDETSWIYNHRDFEFYPFDELEELFAYLEYALKQRAKKYDSWWQMHEPRLRQSHEAAIIYLLIQAYHANPEPNIAGISEILSRDDVFQFGQLNFEIGELVKDAFPFLAARDQEKIQVDILHKQPPVWEKEEHPQWFLKKKYQWLYCIPVLYRSPETQAFIDTWEHSFEDRSQAPETNGKGGTVRSPVSAEQMLTFSDETLIRLFKFYDGIQIDRWSDDLPGDGTEGQILLGGTDDLLREFERCCSLDPERFSSMFSLLYQEQVYEKYAIAVLNGLTAYLNYQFGRVRPPNEWGPVKSSPDGASLASFLLTLLRLRPELWKYPYETASALQACCYTVDASDDIELLILFLFRLSYDNDPESDTENIESVSLNSVRGRIANGATVLATRSEQELPDLLYFLLLKLSKDTTLSVRLSVLMGLPFLAHSRPEISWRLFDTICEKPDELLWSSDGQRFLYFQYHKQFERVQPYLDHLKSKANTSEKAASAWGSISTLAYLSDHITQRHLFDNLNTLNSEKAWFGAIQVFMRNITYSKVGDLCIRGLLLALETSNFPQNLYPEVGKVFHNLDHYDNSIALKIAEIFIAGFPENEKFAGQRHLFDWIASLSKHSPLLALAICEQVVDRFKTGQNSITIYHGDGLVSAYTQIMREADQTDDMKIIQRAIALQESLLKLNLPGMWEALNRSERS